MLGAVCALRIGEGHRCKTHGNVLHSKFTARRRSHSNLVYHGFMDHRFIIDVKIKSNNSIRHSSIIC